MRLTQVILVTILISFSAFASERLRSDSITKTYEEALKLEKLYGASHVLAAFDLDNTLLRTDQDLGGEHWFQWQAGLLDDKHLDSKDRVACDFKDLLHIQSLILSLSQMQSVDPEAPNVLSKLQSRGIRTIVLTSRGAADAAYTVRELRGNGFNFDNDPLPISGGFGSEYVPYDPGNPEKYGLRKEELDKFAKGKVPRPVTYHNGVFFVEGQHKGIMLKTLLKKTGVDIKGLVYIDDDADAYRKGMDAQDRQTARVYDVLSPAGIDVRSIYFTGADKLKDSFTDDVKKKSIRDYLALRDILKNVFAYKRPCKLPIDSMTTHSDEQPLPEHRKSSNEVTH